MDIEVEADGKVLAMVLIAVVVIGGLGLTYLKDGRGTMEVRVTDPGGKGVEGIIVSIISTQHDLKGVTGPDGRAVFGGLEDGKFYVKAEDPAGSLVQAGDNAAILETGGDLKVEMTMVPLVNIKAPERIRETVQIKEIKNVIVLLENPGDAVTITPILADAPPWAVLLNDTITLGPGSTGAVFVQVSPPSDAKAGSTSSFTLSEREGGFKTAIDITLQEAGSLSLPRNIPLSLEKGSGTSGTFRIENNGEGPVKDLLLTPQGEVAPWIKIIPSNVSFISDRGSPQYWFDASYHVFVPRAAEPGTYFGNILCSYGATGQSITLEIEVLPHDVSLDLSPTTLRMKDNEDRYITVEVTNRGEAVLSNLIVNMHPELFRIGSLKEHTIEELGPGETFKTSLTFSYVPSGTYTNLNLLVQDPYTDEKLAEEYINKIEVEVR